MSKAKYTNRKLTVTTTHEMKMTEHRNALIANNQWGAFKERSHGSKKTYNRIADKRKAYFEV